MEIFGVGTVEILAIFIIMIIFVGPKRMIQWAYHLGRYVSRFRAMWAETMDYVEAELKQAGVEVELPRDVPTRGTMNKQVMETAQRLTAPMTKPVKDVLDETTNELNEVKAEATVKTTDWTKFKTNAPTAKPAAAPTNGSSESADLGTWSESSSASPTPPAE
jgi:Sec-independent protein translocase protein TatA